MKEIDLRKGFGEFDWYDLFKFPDNSIKFKVKNVATREVRIIISMRSSEDLITLGLICDQLTHLKVKSIYLDIKYLMYQQDDRRFSNDESFGLRFISNYINALPNIEMVSIYHPHSDKVEFIDKVVSVSNDELLDFFFSCEGTDSRNSDKIWVIPDSGAFKSQFKQIAFRGQEKMLVGVKSRDHETGDIVTSIECGDLKGQDCFIVDDICLGGRTFINIAKVLKENNCGKLFLVVSHGVFNRGVDHILEYFDKIYTTDSICDPKHESPNVVIKELR
jgi:ribose-phosphate pyrophosphokinase